MTQCTAAAQRTKYVLDAEYREQVIKCQMCLMHERGIWVEPEC